MFVWQHKEVICQSQRLLYSFEYWTGNALLNITGTPTEIAQALFTAPFVLVSHGTEFDPMFNYGNQQALTLWEFSWEEFTQMPSRKSAEQMVQQERDRLLAETTNQGFCHYSGIRISKTGKRFHIEDGIIWNVIDDENQSWGQAAVFSKYQFV
ncbi:MEKHLA domain-containing protein [Gloeocapsopsis crepidinum LEGE 06123]|uniref:MEKHLA domain-containing protein n=1 Tax=Gloeocapsopsis crepidinum LEGE 06123 TaxID=588587 RepID=A0ABR9UL55_9CHRO|nr:MEKHLA domain-containing protein [Gloeocapsopsis crepidinum]MBE9188994.1 MEKHLA domain-containing protein [Gloeocapsopsis crepidinum LEGE 06123]